MTAAFGVAAHIRRAAKARNAAGGGGATVSVLIDLQSAADKHVQRVVTRSLGEGAVGA